jgi:Cu2+-exporting ATPase
MATQFQDNPAPLTTVLVVPGMHCAGCMGKVERGLTALTGVETARVNLSARQVSVTHEEAVHVPDLVDALERIGFPVSQGATIWPLRPAR